MQPLFVCCYVTIPKVELFSNHSNVLSVCPFQKSTPKNPFHNYERGTQNSPYDGIRPPVFATALCANTSVQLKLKGLRASMCRGSHVYTQSSVPLPRAVQRHQRSFSKLSHYFLLLEKWDIGVSAELTLKRVWLDGQNVSANHQGTTRHCLPGEILSSSPFRLLLVFKSLETIYINAYKPWISENE